MSEKFPKQNPTAKSNTAKPQTISETFQAAPNAIEDILMLQSTIGNRATIQLLRERIDSKLKHRTKAPQISRSSPKHIHRKLVATGDAAGFVQLANSIITTMYRVSVAGSGEVAITNTDVQGPPTPEAQALVEVLQRIIGDSNVTGVTFTHGDTSTDAGDQRVMIGSYNLGKLDLDDIGAFGTGVQQGITAGSTLVHELQEQYRKQVHGEDYQTAHASGITAEQQASGGVRGTTTRTSLSPAQTRFSIPYTYPDGTIVTVNFTLTHANNSISNVTRTTTRPTGGTP